MANEQAPENESDESSLTPTMVVRGGSSSDAPSPGSSASCWAANLSAALTQCVTLYYLGVPLLATLTESAKARDKWTMGVAAGAFALIFRPKVFVAVAKMAAAKVNLPGSKA